MPAIGQLDYLAHVRADSERLTAVLADADPATRVPSCPDWTVADLLWHLGEVQAFWATMVARRLTDPSVAEQDEPERPDGYAAVLAFFREATARLADALDTTPDDTAVWTWFRADRTAGFVRRRQAHEAVIHRLDAELATGQVTDIDPALATDGVAEVFDWMYSAVPGWATAGTPGPIGRVRTSDTGTEWLVQVGSWSGTSPRTGTAYTDEGSLVLVDSGEAAFSVSGTARDLDAWLWNRPTLGEIALDGDYERFVGVIRSGVQ
ncbi:MAG TPA: maleylpyruvate isomerase family mycothiol-dependent enzyme [Jatrophihabitans sp.]|jgi:uncharacterized protein (TIGR03083 family)